MTIRRTTQMRLQNIQYLSTKTVYPFLMYDCKLLIIFLYILFLRWAGPRCHIPFPPDLILYVNLVAMGPVHLSPVTWSQALRYWIP
jgi:hypothetical protein